MIISKRPSNHHPECRGQHIDGLALQRQHLAIHHQVHRTLKLKLNTPDRVPLRKRMLGVRAIIKGRQVSNQPQSPNRPPPHVLNQAVIGVRVGRDHHGAAGKLTVVKSQKQARPRIELLLIVKPHWKRTPVETCQAKENRQEIPELPQSLKSPVPQHRHICGKSNAQQIGVVDDSALVR